jgi:uncharacterized protein
LNDDYYHWQGDDLILSVRLQPKASRNEIIGVQDNQLKVRLTAPPVDGKANIALCKFIAKSFAVANSQVELISGAHNRQKRLLIHSPTQLIDGIKPAN